MNELTPAQRKRILERLRAGKSLRAIEAETGHRRETIGRYGREAGLLPPRRMTVVRDRPLSSAGRIARRNQCVKRRPPQREVRRIRADRT